VLSALITQSRAQGKPKNAPFALETQLWVLLGVVGGGLCQRAKGLTGALFQV